jgi:hypothetical protein
MTVAGDGGAAGPEVSVAWHSTAVREVAGYTAGKLAAEYIAPALAAKDPGLWGPAAATGAAVSLGWLDAPRASRALLGSLAVLASNAREDGLDHVVLCGMGGASLAAEVISRTSRIPLTVLDSSDPGPVIRALGDRLAHTLVVVSSKSGATIETDSFRRVYERAFAGLGLAPHEIARRFLVVTDPGSPLEQTAAEAGYHVVLADPNVGGRDSALTAFGLVPTALAGADASRLLDEADAVLPSLASASGNPGLDLGAALGGYALAGHDKVVLADRGYLAVMAYLDRDVDRAVTGLRDALAARTTHPVTFGWGPRFLHSTGQYHKGGPRNGLFLQITGAVEHDVEVPGRDFTLGKLQLAQALGDLGALRQRGRPAIRLHLRDRAAGLTQLLDSARASMNGATR